MILFFIGLSLLYVSFFLKTTTESQNNIWFCYRTVLSTKNDDTWQTAQMYAKKSALFYGISSFSLGIYFLLNNNELRSFFIIGLDLYTSIMLIFFLRSSIEKELNFIFDKDGNREE